MSGKPIAGKVGGFTGYRGSYIVGGYLDDVRVLRDTAIIIYRTYAIEIVGISSKSAYQVCRVACHRLIGLYQVGEVHVRGYINTVLRHRCIAPAGLEATALNSCDVRVLSYRAIGGCRSVNVVRSEGADTSSASVSDVYGVVPAGKERIFVGAYFVTVAIFPTKSIRRISATYSNLYPSVVSPYATCIGATVKCYRNRRRSGDRDDSTRLTVVTVGIRTFYF